MLGRPQNVLGLQINSAARRNVSADEQMPANAPYLVDGLGILDALLRSWNGSSKGVGCRFCWSYSIERRPKRNVTKTVPLGIRRVTRAEPITTLNAFDAARIDCAPSELRALLERRDRLFGGTSYLMYDEPVHVARASGVWLYDPHGEGYLDAYNNVPSIGHCHPTVVEAISRQAALLNINTRYLYDIVYDYAERLLATFPEELSAIAFTCTGSESSDLALRIARAFTAGQGVVVTSNAYHGNTTAVAAISPASGPDVPIGQDVRTVRTPDTLRQPASKIGAPLRGGCRGRLRRSSPTRSEGGRPCHRHDFFERRRLSGSARLSRRWRNRCARRGRPHRCR